MSKETAIVILNYNNYSDTKECIESILDITYNNYEIILVDNNSTDKSGEQLKKYFKDSIVYIKSNKNVGYAAGNNIGIKRAIEYGYKYICILNNDTIVNHDFLIEGIEYLSKHEDIAFVSPILLNYSDKKIQSVGGNVNLWTGGCITKWSNKKTISFIGKKLNEISEDVISDYVGGACLLLKTDLINKIGYIPENYFLFFEETEWCLKAKKIGLKSVCLHNWSILHKGSASINKYTGLHEYMMERNRIVFEKRNTNSKFQFCIFILILYFKTLILILKDKDKIKYFQYFKDGFKGTINSKYPFIYIKEDKYDKEI